MTLRVARPSCHLLTIILCANLWRQRWEIRWEHQWDDCRSRNYSLRGMFQTSRNINRMRHVFLYNVHAATLGAVPSFDAPVVQPTKTQVCAFHLTGTRNRTSKVKSAAHQSVAKDVTCVTTHQLQVCVGKLNGYRPHQGVFSHTYFNSRVH